MGDMPPGSVFAGHGSRRSRARRDGRRLSRAPALARPRRRPEGHRAGADAGRRDPPPVPAGIARGGLDRPPARDPDLLHGRGGRGRLHRDAPRRRRRPAHARAPRRAARARPRRADRRPGRRGAGRRARGRARASRRQAREHPARPGRARLPDRLRADQARALRGGTTKPGHWVGTIDFVSPEQIRGERVDARSDVYALGCVLHYVLAGRPPFTPDGDEAKLWAHLSEPPPRPSARRRPGCPRRSTT